MAQEFPFQFEEAGLKVSGKLVIPDPPGKPYVEGKYSGLGSDSFKIELPDLNELCGPEVGAGPFKAKPCFRLDILGKSLDGRIRTKNFPSGAWSDATWVRLATW